MFRGPLLHLGPGLFPRQLALEHLGTNGLALGSELLDEGLLFRGRVGAESGTRAGSEAEPVVARGKASAGASAKANTLAGGKAGPGTGTDTSVYASTEALTRTGGEAAPLTNEATTLTDPLRHPHSASALQRKAAHLLLVLDAQCLTAGEVVDAGKCPRLQATLCERRYCDREQSHGETKELDGAHLRLPMSVGDWTAPFAQWTLRYRRC